MDKLHAVRDRLETKRTVHEVRENSNLDKLVRGLITALRGDSEGDNSQVLTAINTLSRKVDQMSTNLDRIEKEAADAAENVELVRTAIEELKATSSQMQTEIAALKEQVAQGQLDQARLDAAAAAFEKADEDLDAIVLPPPSPEPTPEPTPEG